MQINSLKYWMERAQVTEALQETMKMRLTAVTNKDSGAHAQKKRQASGSASASVKSAATEQRSKKAKRSSKTNAGEATQVLEDVPQYPNDADLKGPLLTAHEIGKLKQSARKSLQDKQGRRFPNKEYRQLYRQL